MRMIVELSRTFRFEAAHSLPQVPEDHKCRRVHGHSYSLVIVVRGPVDPRTGWFMDYGDMKRVVEPVVKALDHQYLNDIGGLENPTSELLAYWVWERLDGALAGLHAVTVYETESSSCTYRGEKGDA